MIVWTKDGLATFTCDRCGAVAMGDGRPIVFETVAELQVVAVRDGWLGENDDPERDLIVCPPCQAEELA